MNAAYVCAFSFWDAGGGFGVCVCVCVCVFTKANVLETVGREEAQFQSLQRMNSEGGCSLQY